MARETSVSAARGKTAWLDAEFFAGPTLDVARALVGAVLHVGRCTAKIVETEAYTTDAASHAVTRRVQARAMTTTFGHVYVYRIYGMHCCLNFTTERHGVGAVLIRAAEPLGGLAAMRRRRGVADLRLLASGPGRLCQALGIDRSHDGAPLGRICLTAREQEPAIGASPRIGVSQSRDLEWRFFDLHSPHVSRGRPGR